MRLMTMQLICFPLLFQLQPLFLIATIRVLNIHMINTIAVNRHLSIDKRIEIPLQEKKNRRLKFRDQLGS